MEELGSSSSSRWASERVSRWIFKWERWRWNFEGSGDGIFCQLWSRIHLKSFLIKSLKALEQLNVSEQSTKSVRKRIKPEIEREICIHRTIASKIVFELNFCSTFVCLYGRLEENNFATLVVTETRRGFIVGWAKHGISEWRRVNKVREFRWSRFLF